MMVVMAVMAEGLHLEIKLTEVGESVKWPLAGMSKQSENDSVRGSGRVAAWSFALLAVCLLLGAQTQDRDTRGLPKTSQTAPPPASRLDINHASVEELLKVPGLTRTWASRIVRFRPYRAKTDLLENGVVSDVVYNRIKDYVIAHRD